VSHCTGPAGLLFTRSLKCGVKPRERKGSARANAPELSPLKARRTRAGEYGLQGHGDVRDTGAFALSMVTGRSCGVAEETELRSIIWLAWSCKLKIHPDSSSRGEPWNASSFDNNTGFLISPAQIQQYTSFSS
jgi:hypothetical protein